MQFKMKSIIKWVLSFFSYFQQLIKIKEPFLTTFDYIVAVIQALQFVDYKDVLRFYFFNAIFSNTTYNACIYWSACLRLQIFTNKHRYTSSNPNNISRYFPLIGDEIVDANYKCSLIQYGDENDSEVLVQNFIENWALIL
jgi:hypothetical protein